MNAAPLTVEEIQTFGTTPQSDYENTLADVTSTISDADLLTFGLELVALGVPALKLPHLLAWKAGMDEKGGIDACQDTKLLEGIMNNTLFLLSRAQNIVTALTNNLAQSPDDQAVQDATKIRLDQVKEEVVACAQLLLPVTTVLKARC